MAYDSVASLAKTIEEFLNHCQNPFSVPSYQEIKSIHDHTTSMLALLQDSPKETVSLERRVRELANKAEDIIQFSMSEKNRSNRGSIKSTDKFKERMRKVAEKMSLIVREMEMKDSVTVIDDLSLTDTSSRFAPPTAQNDMVIGFDDFMRIKDWLCEEESKLKMVAIVGSGGIGKTTLATYAYHHPTTMECFDIRGWVTVSQDYSVKDILSSLLLSMGLQRKWRYGHNIKLLSKYVYKRLKGMRYLVVMDDVWSKKVWDDIQRIFPDDRNGSLIMLTTRQLDVASHFNPYSPPHQMGLMDDDQSWFLLRYKVFGEQDCPHEFELIGKKIAKGCGGLPLSIVIMADLLSSITMTLDSWEAIAEDVISAISTKDGQLEKIISSSFMELPHHLRLCLLYMGGFPADYEIRVSELIKLWIGEGFVIPNVCKTFEDVAEEYVEDLVNTSLVMVANRNYNGKIKCCRLQNVVRDFCIRKVQEHKFLLPLQDYLSNTTLRRYFLPKILQNQRRIILNSHDLHLRETIHNSPMRTIICIQQGGYMHWSIDSVRSFPLLRILHVVNKSDNPGWEPDHVFELIHLRYLAANIPLIPAAILKLQNLQTLIIYRHDVLLPEEIWRLTQLRHLIALSFHPLPHPQLPTSPLQSLQTLSLSSNFECSETIIKIITNLRKLGIYYFEDTFDQDYHLSNLRNLHHLEILKLEVHKEFFYGRTLNPVFPVTLKKLTLSGCRLPWKYMTIIGSLPILEVLKLRCFAFQGDKWETTKGEFRCLKYLLIDESDLQYWSSKSYHFRNLVCLMLYRCPFLDHIPYGIGDIPTLGLIEVDDLNGALVESAKWLQEQSCGNDILRLIVKHI